MSSLREVRSARYQPTWAWAVLGLLTALVPSVYFLAWLLLGANHKLTRHGRQAFLG